MREIKFKGKCTQSGDWVYGDIIHGVNHKEGKIYILPKKVNLAYVKHCHPLDGVEVNPETIGQFEGRKDKNGKDIYEGDIIETHRESYFHNPVTGEEDAIDQDLKGQVVITPSKGSCLKNPEYNCNLSGEKGVLKQYYSFSAYRSEVVGNIHDN